MSRSTTPIKRIPLNHGETASGCYPWLIDRTSPGRERLSRQMAKAMVHAAEANGRCCDRRDLRAMGFTNLEIIQHGSMARIIATGLRPDLAHETDKEFAAANSNDRAA